MEQIKHQPINTNEILTDYEFNYRLIIEGQQFDFCNRPERESTKKEMAAMD